MTGVFLVKKKLLTSEGQQFFPVYNLDRTNNRQNVRFRAH